MYYTTEQVPAQSFCNFLLLLDCIHYFLSSFRGLLKDSVFTCSSRADNRILMKQLAITRQWKHRLTTLGGKETNHGEQARYWSWSTYKSHSWSNMYAQLECDRLNLRRAADDSGKRQGEPGERGTRACGVDGYGRPSVDFIDSGAHANARERRKPAIDTDK